MLDTLEQKVYQLKDQKAIFDLGDGIKGRIDEINHFSTIGGIDSIIFEPVNNKAYRKQKALYQDDFIVEISDWLELIYNKDLKQCKQT